MKNGYINDWAPESGALLTRLEQHGFKIEALTHEEKINFSEVSREKFISEMDACDESVLYVRSPEGKKLALWLVYGNNPGELVSDYNCDDELDKVTDEHYTDWSGRKQPVKLAPKFS